MNLLVFLGRITRTLLAALVVTTGTCLVRTESCLAAMAMTMDPHPDRLFDPLQWPRDGGMPLMGLEGQPIFLKQGTSLLLRRWAFDASDILGLAGSKSGNSLVGTLRFFVLGFSDRITRTVLAALVGTIGTCLVGAERRLTTVAVPTYSHSDRLLDPVDRLYTSELPCARVESKPILFKQRACLLLLHQAPSTRLGRGGIHVSNRLLNGSRYRYGCGWSRRRLHKRRVDGYRLRISARYGCGYAGHRIGTADD